jgi:hypothetical protein
MDEEKGGCAFWLCFGPDWTWEALDVHVNLGKGTPNIELDSSSTFRSWVGVTQTPDSMPRLHHLLAGLGVLVLQLVVFAAGLPIAIRFDMVSSNIRVWLRYVESRLTRSLSLPTA